MILCRCANVVRDPDDSHRRYRCSACKGATPQSSPPSLEQVRAKCEEAKGFLNAIVSEYCRDEIDLWIPARRDETVGARQKGTSDQVLAAAINKSLRQKRSWAAVGWDRLLLALEQLSLADEALGMIRAVEEHREVDSGPEGDDLVRAIVNNIKPGEELPPGQRHLAEPLAAQARRRARGEL